MSARDNGGPAFPNHAEPDFPYAQDGMSLRDWFAGQALAGLLANDAAIDMATNDPRLLVKAAYGVADGMLAERAKAEGQS